MTEYAIKVFKRDRRTASGWRVFSINYVFNCDTDVQERKREFEALHSCEQWRVEIEPVYKTVKSAMTGQSIQIRSDTPYSCDPSQEAFWCN